MKVFRIVSSLLLLFLTTFLSSSQIFAQTPKDSSKIVFWQEQQVTPGDSWLFKVFNKNPTTHPIDRIIVTINQLDTINFNPAGACAIYDPALSRGWQFCLPDPTYRIDTFRVDPTIYSGTAYGGWDSTFVLIFDTTAVENYVGITWRAFFKDQLVSSGSQNFFSRYDNFSPHDTANIVPSLLNCDPSFNITIRDLNGQFSPIDALRFRLANVAGSPVAMRPSAISAPDGWVLDHVTTTDAYFRALPGFAIQQNGGTQGGFIITARSTNAIQNYQIEWTAYTNNGNTPIDYDTVNIATQKPCSSNISADTLTMSNIKDCAYNVTVRNLHVSDSGVSKISRVVLVSGSPNVTFGATPNVAPNWGIYLSAAKDSLFFVPRDTTAWLPSASSNGFSMVLNNATPQTLFNINWTTYTGSKAVSTGTLTNTCFLDTASRPDQATFAPLSLNSCTHVATVTNTHNPPGNIRHVTFTIDRSKGSFDFTFKPVSSMGWNFTRLRNDTSLRFDSKADSLDITGFESQTFTFRINPGNSNSPVGMITSTLDANGRSFSDTSSIKCVIPDPPCDSFIISHTGCGDTIRVFNKRQSASEIVNQLWIMPQGGWLIDTVNTQPFVTRGLDTDKVNILATHNSLSQPVVVRYIRKDSTVMAPFRVVFETHSQNSAHVCDTDLVHASGKEGGKDCPVMHVDTVDTSRGVGGAPHAEPLGLNAYPNPFSGRTEISFTLPQREYVDLVLLDVLGRVVTTSMHGMTDMGDHTASIDGSQLAPGTYYLRLETPYSRITKKLAIER